MYILIYTYGHPEDGAGELICIVCAAHRELLIPKASYRSESGFRGLWRPYVCNSLSTANTRELLIPKASYRSESGFKGVWRPYVCIFVFDRKHISLTQSSLSVLLGLYVGSC